MTEKFYKCYLCGNTVKRAFMTVDADADPPLLYPVLCFLCAKIELDRFDEK